MKATPALCYSQFASMAIRGTADLTKCHFLVMDEFYGSEDLSPAPHYQELDRALFRAAAVSDRQISRPSVRDDVRCTIAIQTLT